jgi:membrane-bound lytic murein transglycosylase B
MHKFRFALLGALAALALGTASAVAMQSNAGGTTDPDSHGDAVASAARTTCPHGPEGVHGECVSAIASAESQETNDEASSSKVKACKASDATEDTSEKKPAKGDKAAKAADHTEDKSEHKAFAACVSGGTAAAPSS